MITEITQDQLLEHIYEYDWQREKYKVVFLAREKMQSPYMAIISLRDPRRDAFTGGFFERLCTLTTSFTMGESINEVWIYDVYADEEQIAEWKERGGR